MYLNSTPCTDGFNRQVHIRNKNSYVTNCIGLFKAFDFLRQSGGYDIIKSVIAPTLPYKKCRGGRTQFGNFIQRLAGILIGKEDLKAGKKKTSVVNGGSQLEHHRCGAADLCFTRRQTSQTELLVQSHLNRKPLIAQATASYF